MLNLLIFVTAGTVLTAFFLIVIEFKKLKGRYNKIYERNIAAKKDLLQSLEEEERALSARNKKLDNKIFDTANLYEITKEMSAALKIADIFQILAKFLTKNFSFSGCALSLVSRKAPGVIDKVYRISGSEIHSLEPDKQTLNLINKMKVDKEPVRISSGITSFLAAPLIIENHLIGALAVENLSPADFDDFLILSRQFALVARKASLYEKVEELAIVDGLTGAYVRRHFLERLDEELERSRRHNFKFSFLMLDVDHFKQLNDAYGHLVGDAALVRIVDILKANIRQIDLVARFGGEEFCVLLPETGKKEALAAAERIRAAVEREEFKVYDESVNISVSIGLASFPENAQNTNDLIEKADTALYRAKDEGRNRVWSI